MSKDRETRLRISFKRLLGTGRAFNIVGKTIEDVSDAFLSIFGTLINMYQRVAFAPFPSLNKYATDAERLNDIENFERQFAIDTPSASLEERARNIEAQWGLVGGQGVVYIEQTLRNAGLPIRCTENIPRINLDPLTNINYGFEQYGLNQFGGSEFSIIANGQLVVGNISTDPIETLNSNHTILIVSDSDNDVVEITQSEFEIMNDLLLRIKPMHTVALAKVRIL
jgi:hypothetical protein